MPQFTIQSLRRVLICFATLATRLGVAYADAQVSVDITRVGDTSHLEFKGLAQWKYDLKRDGKTRIVLRIPPLTSPSLVGLRSYSDSLIEKIEVDEKGIDGLHEVVFNLKTADADFFDYLTEDPSRLIVDYFLKENKPTEKPTEKSTEKPAKITSAPTTLPEKKDGDVAERKRKPAASEFIQTPGEQPLGGLQKGPPPPEPKSDEHEKLDKEKDARRGVFDGGDPNFERFSMQDYEVKESAIIASRGNIFLRFPTLKLESPHLKTLLSNPPIYEIIPQDNMENKQARLLLTLFNNKRRGVFLRTARQFLETYPNTKYDEIIRYMMADVYYGFWQEERKPADFEKALGLYRHLTEKYPESPLATRTLLLMGYSYVERGDSFNALKALDHFLRVKGKTKFTDQVKISIAEANQNLNRYDDTYALLDEVERTAENRKDAVGAAFRKGDGFFQRKDFAGAVRSYQEAINKYPAYANQFPNTWWNMAEAQFWQGNYKQALDAHREYLKRFPDHAHGGYAMTRVGELLEILGGGEKRALGAYLESQFRYRESPGANVGRIRALVARMPEMKEKELKSALVEIHELAEKSKLPDIHEFVVMAVSDGQFARKEYQRSTDDLISFYQKNPNATNLEKFQSRIVRNITAALKANVEKGNFIEALRMNSKYSQTWLKNSDRIDTRFYVGRAFEQAGVYREAAAIFRESLNTLYSIKGTIRGKERGVFEVLPEVDSLNLRLAAVAAREKDFSRAKDYLAVITNPPALSEAELVERAEISADVFEARGQHDAAKGALADLVTSWKGKPTAVSGVYLRLARLDAEAKEHKEAEASLAKIINLQNDTGLVPEDIHAAALELKGDVLLARGMRGEAVHAFKQLLETYDGRRPLAAVRYKAGKILFESGQYKDAEDVWRELKNEKNDLWNKLAKEQLENAKWRGDYKKYIERIPAMQNLKRE